MKIKPLDMFFVVKHGKIHQAIITEVTSTLGLPKGDNPKENNNSQRIYYSVKNGSHKDGTPRFNYEFLNKNDILFTSYLKALRFLKENVVYLSKSDVENLVNQQDKEGVELPF